MTAGGCGTGDPQLLQRRILKGRNGMEEENKDKKTKRKQIVRTLLFALFLIVIGVITVIFLEKHIETASGGSEINARSRCG